MPTGRVKWFDADKGFGFVSREDGGDVFVPKSALPTGTDSLKAGDRVEFGVAEGRRGEQALSLRVLGQAPRLASARRPPEELHGMIEDMIQVLDTVQRDLRRGKYPDRRVTANVAKVVHAVASELEA